MQTKKRYLFIAAPGYAILLYSAELAFMINAYQEEVRYSEGPLRTEFLLPFFLFSPVLLLSVIFCLLNFYLLKRDVAALPFTQRWNLLFITGYVFFVIATGCSALFSGWAALFIYGNFSIAGSLRDSNGLAPNTKNNILGLYHPAVFLRDADHFPVHVYQAS